MRGVEMVDFAQARRAMVDNQLRTRNVTDRRLLAAMLAVEREAFLPPARQALAYIDEAHDLGHGRALPAPAPFAKLVQLQFGERPSWIEHGFSLAVRQNGPVQFGERPSWIEHRFSSAVRRAGSNTDSARPFA